MKIAITAFLITLSVKSMASELPTISVKERLRILLWTEGLGELKLLKKLPEKKNNSYQEELERPLSKI